MKHAKKLASLLLTLVMVLALTVPAFAANTNGTITIENPVDGETYSIYRMFDLESFNTEAQAYSYKITDAWREFVTTGDGAKYFTVDEQGYVTMKEGVTVQDNSEEAAALAKEALAYANSKKLTPAATLPGTDGSYVASGLTLGYYLVDSSLGALCGLTTTASDATIREKNQEPTVDKQVKEGSAWGETSDAKIGDTVEFQTTIHAKSGAKGYVLHDKMTEGLTLKQDSIAVAGAVKDTDYTVAFGTSDGCDFEITFKQAYLDTITADTDIVVTYSAVLNEKAVISTGSNDNETKLNYGDGSNTETEWDKTTTYTYKFDLVKTNGENTLLSGAKFKLYDAETGGSEIALVKEANGDYRVATAEEKNAEGFVPAEIEAGKVVIKGLDTATYWLEETQAPDGYNRVEGRIQVQISGANLDATMDGDTWTAGGVKVENKTGTELPSTGGIGTTIFYAVGGMLVLVAVVLLVTKKRMRTVK